MNYFVDPVNGSNSNNGLGPDASDATNKPWATVGKAMNTGSPISATSVSNTLYLAPGFYYSENLTPLSAISSVAHPLSIIADQLNTQGFKTSGGVRVAPGIVWVTTRTSAVDTNDAGTAIRLIGFETNGGKGYRFYGGVWEGRNTVQNPSVTLDHTTNTDIIFDGCRLSSCFQVVGLNQNKAAIAGFNLTLRNCTCLGQQLFNSTALATAAATADADMNVLVEGCLLFCGFTNSGFQLGASGGNLAGGWRFKGSTIVSSSGPVFQTVAGKVSTVTPMTFEGCLNLALSPWGTIGTSGQVIDGGYNRQLVGAASTNITEAGTSVRNFMPLLVYPDLALWGLELPRADFLGWADNAATTQKASAWSNTSTDIRNRTVRPWGAGTSIGAWQACSLSQDTSSAITGGGTNSAKLTGAGEFSIRVPVDAVAATLSVTTKSTSYGGSNYPQMVIVANPSIGIATDIATTASSASEQTLTSASFTPTAKGIVEVRLISRSSSTTSSTFFDLLTRT